MILSQSFVRPNIVAARNLIDFFKIDFQFHFQWEHERTKKNQNIGQINMIIIKVLNKIQCDINHYQLKCSNGFTHGITNGLIILETDYHRNYNGFTKETKKKPNEWTNSFLFSVMFKRIIFHIYIFFVWFIICLMRAKSHKSHTGQQLNIA